MVILYQPRFGSGPVEQQASKPGCTRRFVIRSGLWASKPCRSTRTCLTLCKRARPHQAFKRTWTTGNELHANGSSLLLALVAASNLDAAQGHAEAMHGAGNLSPALPDHLARSAVQSFEAQELLFVRGQYLDGRVIVQITGRGYQTAERLSAPASPERDPIGFQVER